MGSRGVGRCHFPGKKIPSFSPYRNLHNSADRTGSDDGFGIRARLPSDGVVKRQKEESACCTVYPADSTQFRANIVLDYQRFPVRLSAFICESDKIHHLFNPFW